MYFISENPKDMEFDNIPGVLAPGISQGPHDGSSALSLGISPSFQLTGPLKPASIQLHTHELVLPSLSKRVLKVGRANKSMKTTSFLIPISLLNGSKPEPSAITDRANAYWPLNYFG